MSRSIFLSAGVAALGVCTPAWAVVTASSVVDYQPGSATSFTNAAAALGLPVGNTAPGEATPGALTPFNPPFKPEHIVIVGAGGSMTLRLSSPVPGAGREIGVFSNNGIIDVSEGGTGTAGDPAQTFSPAGMARVSVSSDGVNFVPLSADPFVFANPTNFFTDVSITNYSAPLGSAVADFSMPFTGTLSDFSGLTYPEMLRLLDGSGGGTWMDVSSSGLGAVEYVRFDVPDVEGLRVVLDAVTAVPEPGLLWAPAFAVLSLRRPRA